MRLFARKTTQIHPPSFPEGFRIALPPVRPEILTPLLAQAFDLQIETWAPSPDALAVPHVLAPDGETAAVCVLLPGHYLHQFAVLPKWQKHGIGTAMLQAVESLFAMPFVLAVVDETTTESGVKFWKKHAKEVE